MHGGVDKQIAMLASNFTWYHVEKNLDSMYIDTLNKGKKTPKMEGGLHEFEAYFPFGSMIEFGIHVEWCFEATPLYALKTLSRD